MESYSFKCGIAASVLTPTRDWLFSSMNSYSFKCRIAASVLVCDWLFSSLETCRIAASVITCDWLFSTFKHGIVMRTSVLTRVLFIRQRFGANPSLFPPDLGFCVRPYRSRHAMDKPYVCETDGCGKSYYQRSHLQRQVKVKHHIADVDVDDVMKTSVKPDWCVARKDIQSGTY